MMFKYLRKAWNDMARPISRCGDELTDEEEAIVSKAEHEVFGLPRPRLAPFLPEDAR